LAIDETTAGGHESGAVALETGQGDGGLFG
jgi:hypothetical protein